ncbi:MAG: tetratricopeptide repeat protein [Comamonadaceae bacterium]|nr:tetratricopeptide repeat protein [Comamonadaceae bacterium]
MTTALSDADIFAENFKSGFEELPNAQRFTAEQLEVLYGLGYAQAQQEHWDKALAIFAFLSQYGPTRQHYLAGLALCMQKLHRYEDATPIYSLMLVLFPDQLTPSLRIAECQLAQGDMESALATLGRLDRALAHDDPLKIRTRALLDRLGSSTAHQAR